MMKHQFSGAIGRCQLQAWSIIQDQNSQDIAIRFSVD